MNKTVIISDYDGGYQTSIYVGMLNEFIDDKLDDADTLDETLKQLKKILSRYDVDAAIELVNNKYKPDVIIYCGNGDIRIVYTNKGE